MKNRLFPRPGDERDNGSDLLLEGVFDSNIDRETPGCLRIALWREWASMLGDLHHIGPVWSVVRNGHCVLSVYGEYPRLSLAADGQSAGAIGAAGSLTCHFRAWRRAAAFDSRCRCGAICGVEIRNEGGETFHRICLGPDSPRATFAEWIQVHQATGLEDDEDEPMPPGCGRFHPQSFAPRPGTMQALPHLLRNVLLTAAQREIPLAAGVLSEGVTQTAHLAIERASETGGWLVFGAPGSSLFVEAEPRGTLHAEPVSVEGERSWRLSLVDPDGLRALSVQPAPDGRERWNQLVYDVVLRHWRET